MNTRMARAIVTGGASGLGLAVAHKLIGEGAKVAILDRQDPVGVGGAVYLEADIRDEAAIGQAVAEAAARLGGVTLLAHCAGIAHSQRVLGRDAVHDTEAFSRVLQVNLLGTFLLCRAAADIMRHNAPDEEGERGVIVNTASIAACEGQIGQAAYAASKSGVAGMTLPLAREFARFGLRVMCIAPGVFATPLIERLPDTVRSQLQACTVHPARFGKPAEFAALVCHIYSNPMLNGSVIRLDGALRMPPE